MRKPPSPSEALLERLEWTVLRRLDGLLQGDWRTLLRGAGVDLADLREYQHGDDVRHIDWNVTARLQQPHVRQFHEDRDLTAWFLLDLSGSVDFGSGDVTKLAVSSAFVAALARVLTRHGNRVGALLYGTQVDTVLPPRASRVHVLEMLERMRRPRPAVTGGTGTSLYDLLQTADGVMRRRSLVFVVSDFISAPGWEDALGRLARRHDVVAVRLFDPAEMALPDVGLVTLQDAETGEQLFVDATDPAFRARYAALAEQAERDLQRALARAGVDTLELATDDDVLESLLRFAQLRRGRARLGGARLPAPQRSPPAQGAAAARVWAAPGCPPICAPPQRRRPRHEHDGVQEASMSFQWPNLLWTLLLLPLLVLLYVWLLRRRRRNAVRLASVALARQALGKGPGWRRHVPPLVLLLALATLLLATARPTAVISLPMSQRTILLAMDVSGSMRAEDVKPNRLVASQEAAKAFIADLPREVKVGVVSFAGTAAVVQAPTTSRDDVVAAIDRFQLQRGTATGSGIVLSLATLFPDHGIEIQHITGQRAFPGKPIGKADDAKDKPAAFTPVPPGSYNSAAIIMLTDGQRTTGPDPMDAAKMAAERGVRVYTVGIGTTDGEVIGFEGWSMRVRLDEDTLKSVSALTLGEYFYAGTAEDLKKVYQSLSSRMVVERKETELTALFAGLGALLALLSAALSTWWFGRIA